MTETSAPERVWIQPDAFGWPWECWETPPDPIADSPCVEYIRADRAREILAGELGHDPFSVIVRIARGADVEAFIAFVGERGGSVRHRLTAISALGVDLPRGRPFEVVAEIVKHPAVRGIEANHYMRIASETPAAFVRQGGRDGATP